MEIRRDYYLEELKASMHNGLVKVITGIRRCGKSHLLFHIFVDYLRSRGVRDDRIITVQLDDDECEDLRTPKALSKYIKDRLGKGGSRTYVLIDEIQECKPAGGASGGNVTFYDVLNSLMKRRGVDIYVTGSNSEMLSEDIAGEVLRGRRGTEKRSAQFPPNGAHTSDGEYPLLRLASSRTFCRCRRHSISA